MVPVGAVGTGGDRSDGGAYRGFLVFNHRVIDGAGGRSVDINVGDFFGGFGGGVGLLNLKSLQSRWSP